ncbi:hypothetical protein [Megasphaera hominis]|jgi:hypothetical protein|uniref:Uncharacterized protein n=1 Tax=Megasphaera hominis TaxID=159836 RepID=A0ABR6VLB8_9FIRM|nr:hypothetical protein [Megasphaera hominis]MBC3537006.1 hypothetical protein [Megasphaera hominis]
MSLWRDLIRQCVFMSFFIIPIPIGSYTIHSGSSAAVALISYIVLSFVIPLAYLGSREASFGPRSEVITRTSYVCVWILLALAGIVFSKFMGPVWKHSSFWNWPTFGRDIVFIILMYIELCLTMAGAYVQTRLMGKTEGRGL